MDEMNTAGMPALCCSVLMFIRARGTVARVAATRVSPRPPACESGCARADGARAMAYTMPVGGRRLRRYPASSSCAASPPRRACACAPVARLRWGDRLPMPEVRGVGLPSRASRGALPAASSAPAAWPVAATAGGRSGDAIRRKGQRWGPENPNFRVADDSGDKEIGPTIRPLSRQLSKSESVIGDSYSYESVTLFADGHWPPELIGEVQRQGRVAWERPSGAARLRPVDVDRTSSCI